VGALLIVLISWPLAALVVSLAAGAAIRLRDTQVPQAIPVSPPAEARTIVIPEPRSAAHAETQARIPSR